MPPVSDCSLNSLLSLSAMQTLVRQSTGFFAKQDDELLYVGQAADVQKRLGTHLSLGKKGLPRRFAEKGGLDGTIDAQAIARHLRSEPRVRLLETRFGRKELEEFLMVTPGARLNLAHRKRYQKHKIADLPSPKAWIGCQRTAVGILSISRQHCEDLTRSEWENAQPPSAAGIYLVWRHGELVYLGQSHNLKERYDTHSTRTRFSALRRSIGTVRLSHTFVPGKKWHFIETADEDVNQFLRSCKYACLPIALGRLEIEELLISKMTPQLNKAGQIEHPGD